jgi:diguanylate cyclase (GGDEF)-like protein
MRRSRKPTVFILALGLFFAVFLLDWLSGRELSFSIFYLAPIGLVSWYAGRSAGLAMAFISAVGWYAADRWAGTGDSLNIVVIWNALVRFGFFVIVNHLLAGARGRLMDQEQLASSDPLTGLLNKRAFSTFAGRELARARRYHHPVSIAFVDLDGFKQVNDQMGHATGDLVLQAVAGILRQNTRRTDIVGRLGGDEFALVFPETDEEAAPQATQKILERGHEVFKRAGWPTTMSIGLVTFRTAPEGIEHLLQRGDEAMYRAKSAGKCRIVHEID